MPDLSEPFSFDVFLSHSAKDKDVVRDIAERLRSDGLRVWFDEWEVKPKATKAEGKRSIEEGLERSRVLVLCMSANAFGSEWAELEAGSFRFRDPLNQERRFVRVRLDDAPVKGSLAQFLSIDWRSVNRGQESSRLVEACRAPRKPAATEDDAGHGPIGKRVIRLEYKGSIFSLAFSPNRSRVLAVPLSKGADSTKKAQQWDAETGRSLCAFVGHTSALEQVTWSPDGRLALSGDDHGTLRLWEVEAGRCLRVFGMGSEPVVSLAWSPDGRRALSGGRDGILRLWEIKPGLFSGVLIGHSREVWSVAWSPDGRHALSGSGDNTVRLWEVESGRCLRVFEGHSGPILSMEWNPDGRRALSGAGDQTVRLWEIESGRCLRVLEGHTGSIGNVAWSPDGRRALSGADDETVRLWDLESGRCLRVLEGHTEPVRGLAWSGDGRRAFSGDSAGWIREWDLSEVFAEARTLEVALPASPPALEQVQYTNAKVLLVGDTGVGKSGLAERLIHKEFVVTKSSHARKAYVLESSTRHGTGGVVVHQETMLWDLAGQPAYRLVHQLSMEDAAMACVLFDNRSETSPFEGAAYWSQVLDQARTSARVKKLLVASRIDVGGLPASRDRIEAFASEQGFTTFIPTSAYSGEGCDALLEAIRTGIPWDDLPKVTTEGPLAPLRAYVAGLKGERDGRDPVSSKLFTVAQLHEGFVADYGRKIPLDEFISHLERLEATDAVDLLLFHTTGARPQPETLVLLDPTRVDAYASALLVAAKDEPDGPGHLLESRVREGEFSLDAAERLADPEAERHVLWFVMENLLERDLALREEIKKEDYFVFPSQCTAELKFPGVAVFGVAFGFKGAVRSIYATLIAQLAHYVGFKNREFFHDAAAYRPNEGGRCIVRLRDQGRGQGELALSFEEETPQTVRQGFIEFVGQHLEAKSTLGCVTKRYAYRCANEDCRKPFDDAVVKDRIEAQRKYLLCQYCEEKTPLVDLLASPTTAAESVAAKIVTDAKVGRRKMTAGLVIKAKEAEGKFDVFLSHNSKDKPAVEKIARRLVAVGIRPWLDKWNLPPGARLSKALAHAITTIHCAALFFGPSDAGNWHIMEIDAYLEKWATGNALMIPVILPGVKETPEIPVFVRQPVWSDMRDWEEPRSEAFYRLVCGILERAPGDSPARKFGARDVAEWQGLAFS